MSANKSSKWGSRVMTLLKLAVTLLLGYYVFSLVKWNDSLYQRDSAQSLKLSDHQLIQAGPHAATLKNSQGQEIQVPVNRPFWQNEQALILLSGDLEQEKVQAYVLKVQEGEFLSEPQASFNGQVLAGKTLLEGGDWLVEPGFIAVVKGMGWQFPLLCWLLMFLAQLIPAWRWWTLLKVVPIRIPFFEAIRLNYLGLFFNAVMPGTTGGDLVKMVGIAKHSDRRTDAALSVFVDRVTGLVSMALLASLVLVLAGDKPHLLPFRSGIFGLTALCLIGGVIYFSERLREKLKLNALGQRLPGKSFVQKIDRAVFAYHKAPKIIIFVVLLSIGNHVVTIFVNWWLFQALDIDIDLVEVAIFVPVILMLCAVPISIAGFGLRETLFVQFFATLGVSASHAIAVSLVFGVLSILVGVPGGLGMLGQKKEGRA